MPFELKVLSLRSSKPDELLTALGDVELCVVQNKISGTYSYAAAYVLKFETAVVLLHEKEFMTDYVDPEPPLYFEPGSVPRNLAGSDSIWLSDLLDETRPIRRMSPAARAAQSDEVRVKAREAVLEACRKRAVGK
jgi:hypothetical protein